MILRMLKLPVALSLAGALAAVLLTGCFEEPRKPSEQAQAEAQIGSWVPLGITPDRARRAMEDRGFICILVRNNSCERRFEADNLYCDLRWTEAGIRHRWEATLVFLYGKLIETRVSVGAPF